jgi:hypothetical protein
MTSTQNNGAAAVAPATTPVQVNDQELAYPTFADRAKLLASRGIPVVL